MFPEASLWFDERTGGLSSQHWHQIIISERQMRMPSFVSFPSSIHPSYHYIHQLNLLVATFSSLVLFLGKTCGKLLFSTASEILQRTFRAAV